VAAAAVAADAALVGWRSIASSTQAGRGMVETFIAYISYAMVETCIAYTSPCIL
jgi:hypothetical protein